VLYRIDAADEFRVKRYQEKHELSNPAADADVDNHSLRKKRELVAEKLSKLKTSNSRFDLLRIEGASPIRRA